MPAFEDLTGRTFGRWTVLRRAPDRRRGYPMWLSRCECGNEKAVRANILKNGSSRSCGCLNLEVRRAVCLARNTTHGRSNSHVYNAWINMRQRCYNPRASAFAKYGGRGVTVCVRWRESFDAFLADMGEPPTPAHTIDRIDGTLGYEPGNCRWATQQEQQNNRLNNRRLNFAGRSLTLNQWAAETGLNRETIARRIDLLGWPIERALTAPADPRRFDAR